MGSTPTRAWNRGEFGRASRTLVGNLRHRPPSDSRSLLVGGGHGNGHCLDNSNDNMEHPRLKGTVEGVIGFSGVQRADQLPSNPPVGGGVRG